jgi:hypothetical protein
VSGLRRGRTSALDAWDSSYPPGCGLRDGRASGNRGPRRSWCWPTRPGPVGRLQDNRLLPGRRPQADPARLTVWPRTRESAQQGARFSTSVRREC